MGIWGVVNAGCGQIGSMAGYGVARGRLIWSSTQVHPPHCHQLSVTWLPDTQGSAPGPLTPDGLGPLPEILLLVQST